MDWIKALAATPPNELSRTELVLPRQANHYGTLFGPEALALLGRTAYLAAAQFSRQAVVMAAARGVEFLAPVGVGALLHLHARVVRLGRSSMTVDVRAALDAAPGTQPQEVLRASFEMVAVDEQGRPCPLQPRGVGQGLTPAALNDAAP
ncbi:acyl-CoA thioesterase [Roseateles sp. DAIF2]|uniref:acyl-CoA thioesterase n=1 Tax=Roseateles sp. DAIF2 TaxID=2714952 RepID=UPI0018A29531|nr:acyl-CoA thioesterase [Roseateles sp. DAIF2]QPF75022.1 acyl-CoA thioesterase [Roseateles sp. DAIF2]